MRRNPRERLVHHVQDLERLEELKQAASADLKDGFARAKADGFDAETLKVVLKLRKMTPEQRRERRALEMIYLAAVGMLEGEPLTDEARRRLDEESGEQRQAPPAPRPSPPDADHEHAPSTPAPEDSPAPADVPPPPDQPPLVLKEPAEARQEGADAAVAGKRIYDNPYPAGDPCRAAWDEGWCAQQKSHGMDTPTAYQRRDKKPPEKDDKPDKDSGAGLGDFEKGAA